MRGELRLIRAARKGDYWHPRGEYFPWRSRSRSVSDETSSATGSSHLHDT